MEQKPTEQKKQLVLSSNVKWVVGSIVGIGTGVAKFVTEVRSAFHENIVKGFDFKPTLEAHRDLITETKQRRRQGLTTTEEFIAEIHKHKNDFAELVDAASTELGIISKGPNEWIEGSIQRYRTLSAHARTPLVFSSISTAVIGFAGTSMFMNSLANRKKIDTLAKIPHEPHDQNPTSQR